MPALASKARPPADLVILGARVLDPAASLDARLDVVVTDGVVSALLTPGAPLPANGHRVVDASGCLVAPAFVDPHVHLRAPGREDEETIASGTAAAAAGGYCAVLGMPNTEPPLDSAAALRAALAAAEAEAAIPVGFLTAVTKGQEGRELSELGECADVGAAGFTDDGHPVSDAGVLRRALQYSGVTGVRIAPHCEEPALSRGGHMHEGAVSAELGLAGYPGVAESTMVARDLALAAYEERPLHLLHLSAGESVEALRAARDRGAEVSAEVTPHHLCLTDEAVRSLDPNVKMNPPLRGAADRAALVDALRDGTIDCIATDHAPHARHEKEVPFEAAPFGVTGLETAFAALYTFLVRPGVLPLETVLERLSAGPSRAFGLEPPRVATGEPANLVVLDLERTWLVEEPRFRSLSANSWLLGDTVAGEVRMTLAAGSVVHE